MQVNIILITVCDISVYILYQSAPSPHSANKYYLDYRVRYFSSHFLHKYDIISHNAKESDITRFVFYMVQRTAIRPEMNTASRVPVSLQTYWRHHTCYLQGDTETTISFQFTSCIPASVTIWLVPVCSCRCDTVTGLRQQDWRRLSCSVDSDSRTDCRLFALFQGLISNYVTHK